MLTACKGASGCIFLRGAEQGAERKKISTGKYAPLTKLFPRAGFASCRKQLKGDKSHKLAFELLSEANHSTGKSAKLKIVLRFLPQQSKEDKNPSDEPNKQPQQNLKEFEKMENAVLYPRYSSHGQNEQTIEGQIRVCREFAESKGLNIVNVYDGDKARSASKDLEKRTDFHRMIEDAKKGKFKYIIVYMFDRFARNRVDSIMYKEILRKHGVRVLSALEPVSEDEGGEFYEMYLEWSAEKYSTKLSKRVRDGLDTSVANGTFCGGYLIYGYRIRKEPIAGKNDKYIKYVEIDEEQADTVRYVFKQYADGVSKENIANALNAQGKRYKGKPFIGKTFDKWLVNDKYTGVFNFGERVCDNMYPAIIDRKTFDRAQELLQKNKYFAKSNAPRIPFYLTSKLYCLHCGTPMIADGGVGKQGTTYQYYVCKTARKHACDKKREEKNTLEFDTTVMTMEQLKKKHFLQKIADDMIAHHGRRTDTAVIKSLETRIANTQKEMDDTTTAYIQAVSMQNSLFMTSCDKRMKELAALSEDLQKQLAKLERERGDCPTYEKIFAFAAEFTSGDPHDKAHQKRVIDKLVNAVYVSDKRSVIYFTFDNDEHPFISKEETDQAIEDIEKATDTEVSGSVATGGERGI